MNNVFLFYAINYVVLIGDIGMKNVFIVGSKGIPGAYGGYETFVDKLTEHHQNNPDIKYHVACKNTKLGEFAYHNARCFNIRVPNIGPAQAIYYDVAALKQCCSYIKKNNVPNPIVYILACRIGPFMKHFQKKIHALGGKVFVNPDGHEWMRAKWSAPVRKYWKLSEQMMVQYADLLICDSKNIEKYIQATYKKYHPNTTFIAYGAETRKSVLKNEDTELVEWYNAKELSAKSYYLVVGRFVPENNYEIMIREFMHSKSKLDFALITNVSGKLLKDLKQKTEFDKDSRIKFVGTVYNQELLMKIRENAFGYLHGHEVGGTNPSLLEALSSTDLNLLLDVGFNREVGKDGALYWNKKEGKLGNLIENVEEMMPEEIAVLGEKAHQRIQKWYSWEYICSEYRKLFTV
jgi:rhamnosyltransferase